MIPDRFLPIIKKIACLCDRLDLTWAFTGSLNLVFWGFDLEPHDIDLETDRSSAVQIAQLFSNQAVWSLHLRESDRMQSYFARYDIENVQVEVMGDCRYRLPDGKWMAQEALEKRIRNFDWQDLHLHLLDLEDAQESCKLMGNLVKAERIRVWLENHPNSQIIR
jgi:hypothetical protein